MIRSKKQKYCKAWSGSGSKIKPHYFKPMKNMKIPKIIQFTDTNRLDTPTKCKTCAYHTTCTEDEDEMTKWYHAEKPVPHPCHERQNGWACKGSIESFQRLGLEVKL